VADSLAEIEGSVARMGSYIAVKMENGNTAWIDPNGRVLEINSSKEVVNTVTAEVQEEETQAKNLANQAFDEKMGEKFAEAFDEA
jgi:hypothetical protein